MSYASQQQLTDRFGQKMLVQLTDRAVPSTGLVDAAVVARALADTDAMIDGYLAGRYRLPLTDAPALLADLGAAIAIYKMHRTAATEKIAEDYRDAIKTLRDIASGVVRLNVAGVEPASSGASGVRTTDRERAMTPENLRGFV